jgi:hypothetical protein
VKKQSTDLTEVVCFCLLCVCEQLADTVEIYLYFHLCV